jgi:hypothetical protein
VHINLIERQRGFMEKEQHDKTSTVNSDCVRFLTELVSLINCAQVQRAREKLSSDLLCSHPFYSAAVVVSGLIDVEIFTALIMNERLPSSYGTPYLIMYWR